MTRGGFVRTVLGDIPAADLGVTYAHEHLVIDGGRPVELSADFELNDPDRLS
jgi:phosphotriesterase-related protein